MFILMSTCTNLDNRPGKLDVQIWRGDTWSNVFILTQDGDPIDLSGATVKIDIRDAPGGSLVKTITGSVGGDDDNQITVDELIDIDAGYYWWDLEVEYVGGTVRTYLYGVFNVFQDVTA